MRHCKPIVFAVSALLSCGGAWAQTYKCLDAAGKVTYSSTACDLLGMRNAGEVRDRLQVSPAQKSSPSPQAPNAGSGVPASAGGTATGTPGAAAQGGAADAKDAKKEPERRCFKTAKGYRCNDKPEDD